MTSQKYNLLLESNSKKLVQSISRIFSNQYLYVNKKFRKKILQNKKGYINVKDLIRQPILQEYFDSNNVKSEHEKEALTITASKECSQLAVKSNHIRRICPFDASLFKDIKPIYIEQHQSNKTDISNIREHLGFTCFSTSQKIQTGNHNYSLLYAPQYRRLVQSKTLPFKVINYQKLCRQRERESRFWHNHEHNIYKQLQPQNINRRQYPKYTSKHEKRPALMQKFLQSSSSNEKRMNLFLRQRKEIQQELLMRDELNELQKQEYYQLEQRQYEHDQIDEYSLIKGANPQFNQLLIGLLKEKDNFMDRE